MKLKDALKKYSFLKRLDVPDKIIERAANHLEAVVKGDDAVHITPLAKKSDPIHVLVGWDDIVKQNSHKMNLPLADLEKASRSKFGPRSISVPWKARMQGLRNSFTCQIPSHVPVWNMYNGDGTLRPTSIETASRSMKLNKSAGFPFLTKKRAALACLLASFEELYNRKDPCVLYTRTTESLKTRNVWGFPFADTLYEMMFYLPLLALQKTKWYRAALVSPDVVAQRITDLILHAIKYDLILYSVDFAGFDASVLYQYIIKAFDFIKSCFVPAFHPFIDLVCERVYNIGIVTPLCVLKGVHGVPSGSTFTNEVDSIIQLGIALNCPFIRANQCQVQGDDGVYMMKRENISEFENAFSYAKLKLEKSKSVIANNYVVFCQSLFHIDYIENGHIGGIYPTYRALNRLLFQERFVNFKESGISSKDYYSIRTITILENCKYHPLHEELVRYVLDKEQFNLDVSDDGLAKYVKYLSIGCGTINALNHQYGTMVDGIRGFKTYQLVAKILAEEEAISTEE